MSSKPNVLVLGGLGFVGRNFVTYLVENDLCSKIRVADKTLPATAFLNPRHKAAFDNPIVEYKQANLTRQANVEKIFNTEDGTKWNFVFNCAAETKYGLEDSVYQDGVVNLAVLCAKQAAARGVERYVDFSTAQIYKPSSKPSGEEDKTDPWTSIAKFCLKKEEELAKIEGLTYTIFRPATIYGPADTTGLTPRMSTAMSYKRRGETMKFLWSSDLKINTVHVHDVCRAMWHIAVGNPPSKNKDVFNLVDKSDTDQGSLNKILEKIFAIKTGFMGSILSAAATTVSMQAVAEEANDKHMAPFTEACKAESILNTPISTYLDKELLYNNHLSLHSKKLEATGFQYEHPQVNEELLREVLDTFVEMRLFPKYK
eukprot:TRINITY_DN12094_c0_g1::TRINITY_DN12094_c0_g1_i1::g.9686::m.9686 TRINITY_DN12094_c0_g1::TRINITY_DN12094_c0_g1_i1::g.9686  ORF type:complete len:371 (-),score=139.09,Epimerase/PF01370.16/6.6e-19,NAD_binding_10/PF13460.1/6.7e-08,3Beta_HSD/PF01073.14/6e-07,RmlD_sub_bind/PF04321.12/1.4e-06,NAD_binding_4/PF07993.7/2.6e+02,NAD_binding_4/PF07993.7/0.2,NAD_binding_4/PF07993.7/3.3e+03,Saccharop_dh/PF03435.13/0.035,Saccharop_dh/PF03435.13/1.2e+03,Polysacc_synt_2/PF02719.10/0.045,Polysacc_synt_2/PF02719.10/